jgi:hypothetical protein
VATPRHRAFIRDAVLPSGFLLPEITSVFMRMSPY